MNYEPDVTAAPVAALPLQRTLRSWDAFLEWLPIGIYVCALDGSLIQFNRRAAELWGRVPALKDKSERFCGCHRAFWPNGKPVAPSHSPMAEMLRTGRPVRDRELIVERPDGSRVTLLANLNPLLDGHGRIAGGVNCFQDITERKQAEQRLQARERWYRDMLEALPAAIYTTDAQGRVTFFNQAAVDLSGHRPELGDEWCITWKLHRPDGSPLPHQECPMATALKEGRPIRGTEAVAERPDGTQVPLLPYPTPLYDESGAVTGAVNMLVDITERRQAEEHKMLLLRELAHRVNNTLAIILAIMQQSLRAAPSPEAFAEAFTGRLQALAEAHRLLLASGWTGADLRQLARVELEAFAAPGEGRVTLEGPPVRLGPTLVIALGIVLHELVVNASKYGALSGDAGCVALAWEVTGESADRLRLCWAERGGPHVVSPSRKGLGSRLIERGLPGAAIDWRFAPDGITCLIDLPLGTARDEIPLPFDLTRAQAAS